MIVVLIGPSGAGKSSVAARLDAAGVVHVVPTLTTRPSRTAESEHCLDHRFCTDAEFDAAMAAGDLAGVGRLPGLRYRYGLPRMNSAARIAQLVIARQQHVEELRSLGHHTVVYQVEAAADRCLARLRQRRTDDADVDARSRQHRADLIEGRRLADRIFSNDGSLDDLATAVAIAVHQDQEASALEGRSA